MQTPTTDIEFQGQMGIWFLMPLTREGRRFVESSVSFESWQTTTSGIPVDCNHYAQDIADGAINEGLRVTVNGRPYRDGSAERVCTATEARALLASLKTSYQSLNETKREQIKGELL